MKEKALSSYHLKPVFSTGNINVMAGLYPIYVPTIDLMAQWWIPWAPPQETTMMRGLFLKTTEKKMLSAD